MENIIFKFEENIISENAQAYFEAMCGFNASSPKVEKMKAQAIELKNRLIDENKVNVRGIFSVYDGQVLTDEILTIDNVDFLFSVFKGIKKESIIEIIPYILTAGDYEMTDQSVALDVFFADTYGTAYVDAGRDEIKKVLLKRAEERLNSSGQEGKKLYISDSIGPGFYGMDVAKVESFFKILDYKMIGVEINSHCVMIPVKSCVGMFIILDDESMLPSYDCMSCVSKTQSCNFCRFKYKESK